MIEVLSKDQSAAQDLYDEEGDDCGTIISDEEIARQYLWSDVTDIKEV